MVFTINRKKAVINTAIENQGTHHGIEDLVIRGNELNIQNLKKLNLEQTMAFQKFYHMKHLNKITKRKYLK